MRQEQTMDRNAGKHYIDGRWVEPLDPVAMPIINPATAEAVGTVALGGVADADRAVAAALAAQHSFGATPPAGRRVLLERILQACDARSEEMAAAITLEMGAPVTLARRAQAPSAKAHVGAMLKVLERFAFEETLGTATIVLEPVGVCALITPWNWPLNQIACKVIPALAAGCSMVLKPSELAPLSAALWAQVMHDAGVPQGVFNLVHGDGRTVGTRLSSHPDVDMVSFTGSTRAGIEVARNAAPTVKRVHQELGGKSPNVILEGADLERAVKSGVLAVMQNSGQSCNAPTRMLIPKRQLAAAEAIAVEVAARVRVGDPADTMTQMGPLVSEAQYNRVQASIQRGIDEGARLLVGGPGRPPGLERGWYARPTVFSGVSNDMSIAREEVFGPVLAMLPYADEAEAVRIANDTPYGLSAYVWAADREHAATVARQLRAGMVHINGAPLDHLAPFGGYRQSGNGREWGEYGLREFLEVKAIMGETGD